MSSPYDLLVGLDWGSKSHQVCLLSPQGSRAGETAVAHSATAIHAFLDRLLGRVDGQAGRIAVAIEIPRGALVETLIERGLHVFTLNPKQVDRFRDRHSVAGAKDDRRDAYVLADALRTDLHKFRRVVPDHPLVIQIREISRASEDLRDEANRLANRLREQLCRCAPHLLNLSPAANEPWFWELVARTAAPGAKLSRSQAEKLLRRHRIRRLAAEDIRSALAAERLHSAPGAAEAAHAHILLLLPRLRLVCEQRAQCQKQLGDLLSRYAAEDEGEHGGQPGDVAIVRSMPGAGPVFRATLIAEAASLIATRNAAALRALAGIAPVTRQSGKSRVVSMRYSCNQRLRNAFYHWARTSVQHDPAARDYYAALRARGHSHGRALRSVADRWLRILTAMLRSRTLYEPGHARHLAEAA